jgi:hypothetical protein
VDGIPRIIVFHVDETVFFDSSGSTEIRMILSIEHDQRSVAVLFHKYSKASTFVACIAADRFRMKPFAIAAL